MDQPSEAPNSLRPSAGLSDADELMTGDRQEQKYVLTSSQATQLAKVFAQHLHQHHGPRVAQLPGAQQFATTVYFDTPSRQLYRRAASEDQSVKLRAREYYLLDPSMIALARNPQQLVRFEPVLWFELKQKRGQRVFKRRFGVPKHYVPSFLSNGRITQEMLDAQMGATGQMPHSERAGGNGHPAQDEAAVRATLEEIATLCLHYGEPFEVDCLVNYRRTAWQDESGTLRLTLDRQLAFFDPPEDTWTRKVALMRETLGRPKRELPGAILEVKSRARLPEWLVEALQQADAEPARFSKFVNASEVIND